MGNTNVYTILEDGSSERTLESLLEELLLRWAMDEEGKIGQKEREAHGREWNASGGPVSAPFKR